MILPTLARNLITLQRFSRSRLPDVQLKRPDLVGFEQVARWSPTAMETMWEGYDGRYPGENQSAEIPLNFIDPRADQLQRDVPFDAQNSQIQALATKLGLQPADTREALLQQMDFNRRTASNLTRYDDRTIAEYTPTLQTITRPFAGGFEHTMTRFKRPGFDQYNEHNFPSPQRYTDNEGIADLNNNIFLHTRGTNVKPDVYEWKNSVGWGTVPGPNPPRPENNPDLYLQIPRRTRVVDELQSTWAQEFRASHPQWKKNLAQISGTDEGIALHDAAVKAQRAIDDYDELRPMDYLDQGDAPLENEIKAHPDFVAWAALARRYGVPEDILSSPGAVSALIYDFTANGYEPQHLTPTPPYPKTQDWTKLGLKSELAEAIEGDMDHLALLRGTTHANTLINPALETYYGDIVPPAMKSVFKGQPIRSNETYPLTLIMDISPALKTLYQRYGFPGGGQRIWTAQEAQANIDALAQRAVRELNRAGYPTQIALAVIAALTGGTDEEGPPA